MSSPVDPTRAVDRRTLLQASAAAAALAAGSARAGTAPEPLRVLEDKGAGFPLIRGGVPATLLVEAGADPALAHVAEAFAQDLARVGGTAPKRVQRLENAQGPVVLIAQLGRSPILDALVRGGRIDVRDLAGEWEAYRQIVLDHPAPGVPQALVIIGSDRRGAVYGTYDISQRIGVSPWHWFADVPVRRRADVTLAPGSRRDQPRVRYRGFFINDEDPCFSGWAKKHFGGVNAAMYAHVFELLLRLKGNYLWPAMWGKAFNDDDPRNMVLADAMGVVMGTSHHEPMTRAQEEWHRNTDKGVTGGKWDYATNAENLRRFWRGGIERMMSKGDGKGYDCLVTVGMRGDGDEAMAEGTATELLETIVADQRSILADATRRPAEATPQMWALYKEVQDYYDHGMRVPDDVTLLFADDNWGQIRRLATADLNRKGGYGVYYHFDYVGAPRNYKWLNTNQIEKSWQQMDLAWQRGARTIWIVNVGDLKPMEYPLSFFLDQAWNPEAMTLEAMSAYPARWAGAAFGPALAEKVGALLTRYGQLAARRKPELLDADSFALGPVRSDGKLDGGDFGRVVAEWEALERDMAAVKPRIAADARDAWFQLVEHPILAVANVYRLYYAVAWNRRLAAAGDARANGFAEQAERAFARDAEITAAYHALNGGKWDGMMAQTHIGYTNWQEPRQQVMPAVRRVDGKAAPIVFVAPTLPADQIVIEAPDFVSASGGKGLNWRRVPHLGRTLGAVTTFPQGRPATAAADGVHVDYAVTVPKGGPLEVALELVPTLDTTGRNQQRLGVSVNDGPVQILTDSLVPAPNATTTQAQRDWNKAVEENGRTLAARFPSVAPGRHVVKVWRIDDNVVLQRLVVTTGA
ncbi:glycosyl hydrolase 115 family protein [Sphingomonas trueperi]|uniref:Gylcosyl hydrolase 115 C-terminal domain-containing protein n=1 Tax=Sphingomonas trueperi TaxID=53317 RepID=A0A7X6BC58_9SPHN|nr:glycosyl hydrolase 115 family protein [Sphingomonas trueperi]NJB96287.1 hypothetical protein [Sphingomonas trueperi]